MKFVLIFLLLTGTFFTGCGDGLEVLFKSDTLPDENQPADDPRDQGKKDGTIKIAINPSEGIWFNSGLYLDTYAVDAADTFIDGDFAAVVNLLIAVAPDPNNIVLIREKTAEYRVINPALFNPLILDSQSIDITDGMPDAIHTFWPNENLYINIQNDYKAGYYNLILKATNNNVLGNLPLNYTSFNLDVIDGTSTVLGTITITASSTEYNPGSLLIYLGAGDSTFNLLWKNDQDDGNYDDSNIQIKDINLVFVSE